VGFHPNPWRLTPQVALTPSLKQGVSRKRDDFDPYTNSTHCRDLARLDCLETIDSALAQTSRPPGLYARKEILSVAELSQLLHRIHVWTGQSDHWVVIRGKPRSGKTALLQTMALHLIHEGEALIWLSAGSAPLGSLVSPVSRLWCLDPWNIPGVPSLLSPDSGVVTASPGMLDSLGPTTPGPFDPHIGNLAWIDLIPDSRPFPLASWTYHDDAGINFSGDLFLGLPMDDSQWAFESGFSHDPYLLHDQYVVNDPRRVRK